MHDPGVAAPVWPRFPQQVVRDGEPLRGRYAGRIDAIDWSGLQGEHLRSAWWRRLHHKRWHYVGMGSREVFVGVAIVDVGWCMSAFAYVFDRVRQRVVADWSQEGLPGLAGMVSDQPVQGTSARFDGFGAHLSMAHGPGDVITWRVDAGGIALQAELALGAAAPFLLAVGPVAGGVAHATQKSSALPVRGSLEVDGQRWDLSQAVGSMDYSNGHLPRRTAWQWANAHQPGLGFNLQSGYFGAQENALWLDDTLIPLGAAHFDFEPDVPLRPWHVRTDDGLISLRFVPEGGRETRRHYGVAASNYMQAVGCFEGVVRAHRDAPERRVSGVLGVTEDHQSLW